MGRYSNGWVKLWRKAVLGDIGSNFTRQGLFDALMVIANQESSIVSWKGKPRTINRGEMVTSIIELASLGGVDRKTVKKHLDYLAERETIVVELSTSGLFISIPKYDFYQGNNASLSGKKDEAMAEGMDEAMDKAMAEGMDEAMDKAMAEGMDEGVPYNKEINNIRNKEKEEGKTPPPLDPFFKKSFDPKKLPRAAEIWNANCGHLTKLTGTTRNWNDRSDRLLIDYGEDEFARVVKLVSSNPFLSGQNKIKWKVTFSWIINPDNFGKVLAGDYDASNGIEAIMAQLEKAFGEAS